MNKGNGYRGYNGSRPYSGLDFPQNVQNLIIRNYCQKYNLPYLLSASEYKMKSCYMILEEIMAAIDSLQGVVLFSIFMLPESREKRLRMYKTVLDAGCSLHGALEDVALHTWEDVQRIEDIVMMNKMAKTDEAMEAIFQELASADNSLAA